MTELDQKVRQGLRWSLIGQLVAQGAQFPTQIALARLLSPEHFGVVGQVIVFTGVANMLADFGLGGAIVQHPELSQRQLSTLYWINAGAGLFFTAFFCAAAPVIAWFYSNPDLTTITMALGATFLLTSLRVTQYNLLRRRMQFAQLAMIDGATQLAAGIGAVTLAALGAGVWALVALRLFRAAVPLVLLWITAPFKPELRFDLAGVRSLLRFGGYLLGYNLASYTTKNLDNLLVGKFAGEAALGVYMRAFDFMLLPTEQISQVVTRVTVPALSRLQTDHVASRALVLQGIRRIALISFPVMTLFAVTAEPLVSTVFGSHWLGAAPILRVFCGVGMLSSVGTTVGWIYVAQGRTDLMMRWELVAGVVRCAAMAVGLVGGPLGVATGLAAANALLLYPLFAIPGRLIGLRVAAVARALQPTLFGTAALGITAWLMRQFVPELWFPPLQLVAIWIPGALAYLLALAALGYRSYGELIRRAVEPTSRPGSS